MGVQIVCRLHVDAKLYNKKSDHPSHFKVTSGDVKPEATETQKIRREGYGAKRKTWYQEGTNANK